MNSFWQWWLPAVDDKLTRGRVGLVVTTCAGIVGAMLFLLFTWLLTGDLEGETAIAAGALSLLLLWIALAARSGRVTLAAWLLVGLLFALITADVAGYGLGSPAPAAYFLPVLLALCALGFGAGIGVAVAASAAVWAIAAALAAGWYEALTPFEISHLTFNAPTLTVLLGIGTVIVGVWTRYLTRNLKA